MTAQTSKYTQSLWIDLTEAEVMRLDAICKAGELTREAFVKLIIADSLRSHSLNTRMGRSVTVCDVVSLLRANSQKLETVSRVLELLSLYIPDVDSGQLALPQKASAEVSS